MNDCIEYKGAKNKCGYGYSAPRKDGKPRLAHRRAYLEATGIDPGDLYVCHKCDNPSCINVDHLFLGTHQDNMADKVMKGRAVGTKGSRNGNVKITEEQAKSIISDPRKYIDIAKDMGISKHLVHTVKRGKSWAYLDRTNLKTSRGNTRMTAESATAIRNDRRTAKEIAADYGITVHTVAQIRQRITFKYAE